MDEIIRDVLDKSKLTPKEWVEVLFSLSELQQFPTADEKTKAQLREKYAKQGMQISDEGALIHDSLLAKRMNRT